VRDVPGDIAEYAIAAWYASSLYDSLICGESMTVMIHEPIDKPVEVRTQCVLAHSMADIQSYSESLKSSSLEFMGGTIHADAHVWAFMKDSEVLRRIMLPR
jgi:hypothetical protein